VLAGAQVQETERTGATHCLAILVTATATLWAAGMMNEQLGAGATLTDTRVNTNKWGD